MASIRVKDEPPLFVAQEGMPPNRPVSRGQPSVTSHGRHHRSEAPTPSEGRFEPPPLVLQINDTRMMEEQERQKALRQAEAFHFMNGSFEGIAKKFQHLADTLGDLHSLGIQHDIQLPELILVGDQSAGKSSLMSGLAGINLPRSGGICTRCVTHIRVSRHATWSCRVSLRINYAYSPPASGFIHASEVTDRHPFLPWKPTHGHILDFKTLDHPNEIEDVLKWAQLAILNPSTPHEQYIPGSGHATLGENAYDRASDLTEAKFSPNVISLEIKHPDFPDLSFYDLPGVFVRPEHPSENYLVKVVENLAKWYINNPQSMIIWAVPMNVDPMNSTMSKIIEDSKALDRTIGVMTKADLLPKDEGARRQWHSILDGQTHKTGHGYYVTSRLPDDTLEGQNKWEDYFFDDADHWPRDFAGFRDRCGLRQLHLVLSDKLGENFARCLPKIKQKISDKLAESKRELEKLPELPTNIEFEVRTSLRTFASAVASGLGDPEFESFYQRVASQFQACLESMKPKVIVKDPSDLVEIIDDSSDDENGVATPTNGTTGKRRANDVAPPSQTTPSKRMRTGNAMPKREGGGIRAGSTAPSSPFLGRGGAGTPFPVSGPFADFRVGPAMKLREIREVITRNNKAGKPGLVGPKVHEELCRKAVEPWNGPLETFLNLVMLEVEKIVDAALNSAFKTMQKRLIYKRSRFIMDKFLSNQKAETRAFLLKMLAVHTRQLFTMNEEAFKTYRRKEEAELQRHRHIMRWQAWTGEAPSATSRVSYENMTSQEREKDERRRASEMERMGKDPFQAEVDVFAYVRGYYRLAAARFTDTAALILYSDMIPQIERKLAGDLFLEQELGLWFSPAPYHGNGHHNNHRRGGLEVFERLMAEDEATAQLREEVRADVKKFERALESIAQLEAKSVLAGGEVDSNDTMAV